jgi:ribosome-associated protein
MAKTEKKKTTKTKSANLSTEKPGKPEKPAPKPKRIPAQVTHAVTAADDKQAVKIVVLDLRKSAAFTDFFVIASGTNTRQVRAIADAVMERLAAEGVKPSYVEGYDRSEWILLDYFDFIVHVFAPETRVFYDLERLWGNAERTEVPAAR